ncbi:hypothetical protein CYMTET_18786 [Cymbomonas tetramitiformis]|uniref:Uncharacterized protein n=1 Tax=Cymbomonas tetramitiformis TaxID=36881 RepID=A0AAE0G8P4_9CHLO|nr:hypothetical protein CYMTET_18786 [Cymbomonas tetramitiformis]
MPSSQMVSDDEGLDEASAQELDFSRKKRFMKKMLRYNSLEKSSAVACLTSFPLYLWSLNEQSRSCTGVRMPDTVLMRDGRVSHWMFTDKSGQLKRKGQEKLEDRSRMLKMFAGSTRSPSDNAAMLVTADRKVRYLNIAQMEELFAQPTFPDGILQKLLVQGGGNAQTLLLASWSATISQIDETIFEVPSTEVTALKKEDTCSIRWTRDKVPERLQKRINNTCQSIANHVKEVSPHGYEIANMKLHFKEQNGVLYLLWCDTIQITANEGKPLRKEPQSSSPSRNRRPAVLGVSSLASPVRNMTPVQEDPLLPGKVSGLGVPHAVAGGRGRAGMEAQESRSLTITPPVLGRSDRFDPSRRALEDALPSARANFDLRAAPRAHRLSLPSPVHSKSAPCSPADMNKLMPKPRNSARRMQSPQTLGRPRVTLKALEPRSSPQERARERARSFNDEISSLKEHSKPPMPKPSLLRNLRDSNALPPLPSPSMLAQSITSLPSSATTGIQDRIQMRKMQIQRDEKLGYSADSGSAFSVNTADLLPQRGAKAHLYDSPGELTIRARMKLGMSVHDDFTAGYDFGGLVPEYGGISTENYSHSMSAPIPDHAMSTIKESFEGRY